jgi:hypothetical protein
MKNESRAIPFGLLFEEAAAGPRDIAEPTYDEERDLSFVEDSQGRRVPLVELSEPVGTQTETKIHRETADTDPGDDQACFSSCGTTTKTSVRTESTDTDPQDDRAPRFVNLATESITFIQAEATDTDPQDDQARQSPKKPLVGTDTVTEIKRENTDRD